MDTNVAVSMHVCRGKNFPSEMLSILFRFDVVNTDVAQLTGNVVSFDNILPGAVIDLVI